MAVSIGGHLVAHTLAREGVRCVFTLCGGHVAPIYDGCLRENIDIVDVRHEQAAAHAADGWARLTRTAGVCIVTAGPGVTDAVTGVGHPRLAHSPLVGWDGADAALRSLVQRLNIPVVMNGMGRGALPGSNPHALNLARKHAFRSTDLMIVVGTPLDFRVGYGASIHQGAKIVQIDRDPLV